MRRSDEIDFLPAAVEIAEAPATPAARLTSIIIAGIVVMAVAWSWVSVVDIVATAGGRTLPAGHVKTVQPLEMSVDGMKWLASRSTWWHTLPHKSGLAVNAAREGDQPWIILASTSTSGKVRSASWPRGAS